MNILAIDQGTSATKALVVDEDGAVLAVAECPVHPAATGDGAVEQDPAELLASVLAAGRAAVAQAGVVVHGVGLANQGETVLVWDRATGRPLTTALSWQDRRAASVTDGLADRADRLTGISGLPLDPYFSAPKMAWLRRHRSADGVVTTTDTWLLHALTGAFVTDVTTASRSMVLDLDTRTWSDEAAGLFDLDPSLLPEVVGCAGFFGMAVAGVIGASIAAAVEAAEAIRRDFDSAGLERLCRLTPAPGNRHRGRWAARALPFVFGALWALAFAGSIGA